MNKYLKIVDNKYDSSKYKKWYIRLCEKALNRKNINGYIERHHILPKSLCENEEQIKDIENIVCLTAKEHYIAHLLLWKFDGGYKMTTAFLCMNMNYKTHQRDKKINSIIYEKLRISLSEYKKIHLKENGHPRQGVKLSEETKNKISKSLTGFKMSDETKRKISEATPKRIEKYGAPNTGKRWSDEYKSKMSNSCKKVKKTDEWNKKNSLSNTGRIHIANVVTKERRRPYKEDAEQLLNMENSDWIKLASMKPIPDKKED